jgi:hypothetical protein
MRVTRRAGPTAKFIFSAHKAKITKLSRFRKQNACRILGLSYALLNLDQDVEIYSSNTNNIFDKTA